MNSYIANIAQMTVANQDFRHVIYTTNRLQLVLMSLSPGQDIGTETNPDHDKFFRIEAGSGTIVIDGVRSKAGAGHCIIVPAGAALDVINDGAEPLRMSTIYGPAQHVGHLVQATKAEADADAAHDTPQAAMSQ
ncbi:MAG: cupin domain-containing protein [Paracoccus sp. (in: a-proteobacteria)]|uniref:cupin domain-containing protein n=1 Tax=Paracoccus sp. TaxID=267 RepID=UPI00391C85FB